MAKAILQDTTSSIFSPLLSVRETAAVFRGSPVRVYRLLSLGWLESIQVGGRRLIVRESVERCIEAARTGIDVVTTARSSTQFASKPNAEKASTNSSTKGRKAG